MPYLVLQVHLHGRQRAGDQQALPDFLAGVLDQGLTPRQGHLAICRWILLVTKVSFEILPSAVALQFYCMRCRVERIFKQLEPIMSVVAETWL